MNSKKILIVSPHIDDEVLGCGGLMAKDEVTADIVNVTYTEERLEEQNEMLKRLGKLETTGRYNLLEGGDGLLDTTSRVDLTTALDDILARTMYDGLYIPYRSHHQDHQFVYDSCMSAIRLKQSRPVPVVALYEYPFVQSDVPSTGAWYVNIGDTIDKKVHAFEANKSQVKSSPSPLNENGIRTLARMRGMECGLEYAEKFYLIRCISEWS